MASRSFYNQLLLVNSRAITTLSEELRHHALSYRSITMMANYAQILPTFFRSHIDSMSEEERQGIARWLEWVLITVESSKDEYLTDFSRLTQRTTIIFADIIEGFVESVIGVCLLHLPNTEDAKNITGYRNLNNKISRINFAFRSWEKRLFERYEDRPTRFSAMLETFFPRFRLPENHTTLSKLLKNRNKLTHEIIEIETEIALGVKSFRVPLKDIDDYYSACSDFILSVLDSVPQEYQAATYVNVDWNSRALRDAI